MAKQTKKIRRNIEATREIEEEMNAPEKPKYKAWENIVLVGIICLTLFLLTSGWQLLDNLNRVLYSVLLVALLMTYAQRRMNLTATQLKWMSRLTFALIFVSMALFAVAVYLEHFA